MALSMTGGERSIDLEDLIPAQVFGILVLVQFGIAKLTAYDGTINLADTVALGGVEVSLAFIGSAASLAVIVATNELTAEDVMFWEEDAGELDQVYGFAVAATFALLVLVEFSTYVSDLLAGSDVLATLAFVINVIAVWAIVWVR